MRTGILALQVSTPGRPRSADAQGTALNPAMRAGVRCGPPAPLRVATGRAQPEPKHRFGRWRRPATGCGAGVSNNQCSRTKKFRLACPSTVQGTCRRTVPHTRSAPGKPMSEKKCSMQVVNPPAAGPLTRGNKSRALQGVVGYNGRAGQRGRRGSGADEARMQVWLGP